MALFRQSKVKFLRKSRNKFYILCILPTLLLTAALSLYPSLLTILYSFTDKRLGNDTPRFVGLENYLSLFQNEYFLEALLRTLVFVGASILLRLIFGILLALLLNQRIKGTIVPKVCLLIPWVLSEPVAGAIWLWMLNDQYGLLTCLLKEIGLPSVGWLTTSVTAMGSIIFVSLWKNLAFSFLMFQTAIQNVPKDIYENCRLDGSGFFDTLRYITLPLIRPALLVNIIMVTASSLNQFSLVYTLTGGGPLRSTEVIGVYLNRFFFEYGAIGVGAAVSMVILLISIVLSVCYCRKLRETTLY